ncbi:MAG: type II toxin-antitoxin system PemK/MazF family toxin [Acidobacteria bacterium]|jgi:mRNA interferase MazF|nr:type II toxin-antitoxin system PemK/MazF family toxin [Acidobacteriota bacterium]MBA3786901.1 type II toxin-antitoxin system PemK/MazF family toxin [Acidobacteriota bacterium]MBA4124678.1 type II toxin-antitoxin system PemK/MazF family toxin [Acidobacteriota bacterium]
MTTPNQPSTDKIKRGSVVLLTFPNSDLRTAKLRPALIIQADDLNTGLEQVVLAMNSSNLNRANHKSRILIETKTERGKGSGLLFDSVIMTDNLATISLSKITRVIGESSEMSEIDNALRNTLNL